MVLDNFTGVSGRQRWRLFVLSHEAWYKNVGKILVQPTFLDQRALLRGRLSDLFEKALVPRSGTIACIFR